MNGDLLWAVALAPMMVIPACRLGLTAARWARRCHQALTWRERLIIGGFLVGALCQAAALVGS